MFWFVDMLIGCRLVLAIRSRFISRLSTDAEKAGLGRSFFERAYNAHGRGEHPAKFCMLTTQYRMHAAIAQFPNQCGNFDIISGHLWTMLDRLGSAAYDGVLGSAAPPARRALSLLYLVQVLVRSGC